MDTFSDIIAAFGGVVPFRDAMGLPDVNARQMKQRDSIPAHYWPRVAHEAQQRGIDGVTIEGMAKIAEAKFVDSGRTKQEVAN